MILLMKRLRILNETEIPEMRNSGILELLNENKISGLRNSEIIFSQKFSYDVKFNLNRFYDVMTCNSFFLARFSNSGIPEPDTDVQLY